MSDATVPELESPEVLRSVVAHETTRDIVVWAPAGADALPIVYLVHGLDGTPETVEQLGMRLAASGHVVFAPTWVMGESMIRDLECGYRFVRSIAADHGGDLALPVTSVGHSAGANLVIGGAVSEALLGPRRAVSTSVSPERYGRISSLPLRHASTSKRCPLRTGVALGSW